MLLYPCAFLSNIYISTRYLSIKIASAFRTCCSLSSKTGATLFTACKSLKGWVAKQMWLAVCQNIFVATVGWQVQKLSAEQMISRTLFRVCSPKCDLFVLQPDIHQASQGVFVLQPYKSSKNTKCTVRRIYLNCCICSWSTLLDLETKIPWSFTHPGRMCLLQFIGAHCTRWLGPHLLHQAGQRR